MKLIEQIKNALSSARLSLIDNDSVSLQLSGKEAEILLSVLNSFDHISKMLNLDTTEKCGPTDDRGLSTSELLEIEKFGSSDDLHHFVSGEYLESLLAKRQQYKEDLAAGKISPAEHQKFLDDLQAANNCPVRNNINRLYGFTGSDHQFIDAGKLIKGKEKVLVLVPHGTPEELNVNSIKFWELQDALLQADIQENPETADLKDPHYTLMDPKYEEFLSPSALTREKIPEADIVLWLNRFDRWEVLKTPHQKLEGQTHWILKFPTVKLSGMPTNEPTLTSQCRTIQSYIKPELK